MLAFPKQNYYLRPGAVFKVKDRFEAERLLASAEPPSGDDVFDSIV